MIRKPVDQLALLDGHDGPVMAFAIGHDGYAEVWHSKTREKPVVPSFERKVTGAMFMPEGDRFVVHTEDWSLHFPRLMTDNRGFQMTQTVIQSVGTLLDVSTDGAMLATQPRRHENGGVKIWSAKSLGHMMTVQEGQLISAARFSPDSSRLATAVGEFLSVWELPHGAGANRRRC